MKFVGKTAVITGAAAGIGRATAIRFAEEGANVVLLDINYDKLVEVKEELSAYADKVLIFECDIRDEKKVNASFEEAFKTFGKVDILVNNAAIWNRHARFLEIPVEEWGTYLDINVMGAVYCTRAALPGMIERKYGRIINVASVAGVYGISTMTHYSATKGALIAFTRALAKEVVKDGVLVNAVAPGSVSPGTNPDIDYHQPTPLAFMGRTGTDRENANLIAFLASDEASYISGQSIQIDGCRKTM